MDTINADRISLAMGEKGGSKSMLQLPGIPTKLQRTGERRHQKVTPEE